MSSLSTGRDIFSKFKPIIRLGVKAVSIFPKSFRLFILQKLRRWRGKKGVLLRYLFLCSVVKQCGDNVAIMEDVYLYHPELLSFGENVSIHPMCYLNPGKAFITIGKNVSIAHGTTIIAESHTYSDSSVPIKYQDMISKEIIIGDNVWIGAKCTVLMGIRIGDGVVIGANSVVTHNISENVIAVGSPAVEIKNRID